MLTFLKQNKIIESDLAAMLDVGTNNIKGGIASIFVVAHHFSQSLSQLLDGLFRVLAKIFMSVPVDQFLLFWHHW